MNEEYQLKMLMANLEGLLDALADLLNTDESLTFVGYETSQVQKVDEDQVLANGQKVIEVATLDQWQHRSTVLGYYKRFYLTDGCSSRFVSRMPGLIVSSLPADVVINLIDQINTKKDEIKAVVQHQRNHQQRHTFIHQVFPQVMTEQLYRRISYSQRQVKSVWFSWCKSRQVNYTYTPEAAIKYLAEQVKKPKGLFTPQEWQANIEATIVKIQQDNYRSIQRERVYRTFPVVDHSYYANGKLKTNRFNAIMPWILLDQAKPDLPSGSGLNSFVHDEIPAVHQLPAGAQSVFKPLKLIGFQ
jgi:hypothetical protein